MPKRIIPSANDKVHVLHEYSSGDSDLDLPNNDGDIGEAVVDVRRSRSHRRRVMNYPRPHSHLFRDRLGGRIRGGKHARRQENSLYLTTLHKITEEESEDSLSILPEHNTVLKHLFTSCEDYMLWEKFVSLSEEDQEIVLSNVNKPQSKHSSGEHTKRNDPALQSLDPHLRKLLLQTKHVPKDFMKDVEDDLRDYFYSDRLGVIVYIKLTSFQRMLVHGICQYNSLKAQRVEVDGDVYLAVSTQDEKPFSPPDQLLCSVIKK